MAKIKIEDVFEVFAVVNEYGDIVTQEFDGNLLVYLDEQSAVDNCDTEANEQVVKIKGNMRYKVKQ